MNLERAILIAFLGNYLTNTVVAALVALVPASAKPGIWTPQYISYVILAAVIVGILTWWYLRVFSSMSAQRAGIIFGVTGFLVALLTAFVTGLSGVLTQTGSVSQMAHVVPNFWPFLASVSTLVLAIYWVVPAAIVGWWKSRAASPTPMM